MPEPEAPDETAGVPSPASSSPSVLDSGQSALGQPVPGQPVPEQQVLGHPVLGQHVPAVPDSGQPVPAFADAEAFILTADTIVTMDAQLPRASAVAVAGAKIVAVGTLAECAEVLPGAPVLDSGAPVLMPGFIDPHSHPFLSGLATQLPALSIAPWKAPRWSDVLSIFSQAMAENDAGLPLLFNGFDALLHGRPAPTAADLDEIFGDRIAVVVDNSGHACSFTSALIRSRGWDAHPPADPIGGSFARDADGALIGISYEIPANTAVLGPVMQQLGGNPLGSAAEYYALMARAGITSTSDMTFSADLAPAYEALAVMPSSPLRVSLWEVSTAADPGASATFSAGEERLVKQGVKLWTDGSPWIGNVATSFPYVASEATERAGIDPATAGGASAMNYSRAQVDAILDRCAPLGWQMSFHANGDLAIDFALDAYERALAEHGLLGTDHRWRIEHAGAGRREQFERAARLGVHVSLAPFQYYFWGDLLDGHMFAPEHGARWQAFAEAVEAGVVVSLHNDGSVSPPAPILNVQTAVTRRTSSGRIHAPQQAISVDAALKAHTIDAARTLHREHLVGSIAVGKLADFVELSADPYEVTPRYLAERVQVLGTWVDGARVDLPEFLAAAHASDPAPHVHHAARGHTGHGC
ncbi:amidohydrolase [Pseudoclavibacter sp. Z016]|uniref:amidohydrolase n=1 Tax=Pseudoclavibacter sp. Z016 TaxID=2080581 RepID=UPI001C6830FB|nr:amidohydrolase [Pseudoclavibacter sp. Z016]